MRSSLAKEQVEAIVAAYRGGFSGCAIAKRLGLTENVVNYHLRKCNVERRPRGKLTPAQRSEIVAAHAGGVSGAELARRFDISPAAIWKILQGRTGKTANGGQHERRD